jgi:hypothetical protein
VKDAWGKLLGHAGMEEGSEDEIQMILMELIEPNPTSPGKILMRKKSRNWPSPSRPTGCCSPSSSGSTSANISW